MFPPKPAEAVAVEEPIKTKKTRRKLKDVAGKIGKSKYYYDKEGNIVDEEGKPVTEKLAGYFGKREAIAAALPKVAPKRQTSMMESKNLRTVNNEINRAIRATENIAQSHEMIQSKLPTMFDEIDGVVKTLSNENDAIIQKLIKQNQDFQDKVIETMTGVPTATKAGGAKPRKIKP